MRPLHPHCAPSFGCSHWSAISADFNTFAVVSNAAKRRSGEAILAPCGDLLEDNA